MPTEYTKKEMFHDRLALGSADSDWNSYTRTLAHMLEAESINKAVKGRFNLLKSSSIGGYTGTAGAADLTTLPNSVY